MDAISRFWRGNFIPNLKIYSKIVKISSTSNCTDYQSQRLNIRYQIEAGDNKLVHTVNGTVCAIPRIIISILENYQQEDGSIIIPNSLIPFMGGISKIASK
jgi:seryl-tRNA synthetase